jgi:PHP family Zn ribbon phosphoesterase
MKEGFKTCTNCNIIYKVSDSPSGKENCRDCYNANRKIVRQELAERNGCRNYAHYMKLKKIEKINEDKSREVWAENLLKTYL